MNPSERKRIQVKTREHKWTQLNQNEPYNDNPSKSEEKQSEPDWTRLNQTELKCELEWSRMKPNEPKQTQVKLSEPEWICMNPSEP